VFKGACYQKKDRRVPGEQGEDLLREIGANVGWVRVGQAIMEPLCVVGNGFWGPGLRQKGHRLQVAEPSRRLGDLWVAPWKRTAAFYWGKAAVRHKGWVWGERGETGHFWWFGGVVDGAWKVPMVPGNGETPARGLLQWGPREKQGGFP
jgi:hypothetical protein